MTSADQDPIHEGRAGVYLIDTGQTLEALEAAANQRGYRFMRIDGHELQRASDLIAQAKTAFQAPGLFGTDWDALLVLLRDLSWLPAGGWVLVLDGLSQLASHDQSGYDMLLDVLWDAAQFWTDPTRRATPLIILIS